MTQTVHRPTVEHWEQQTTDALAKLRAARATWDRCPSAENAEKVDAAEARLDYVMDQRARAQIQAQADEIAAGRAEL